jgi:hypothetical protein
VKGGGRGEEGREQGRVYRGRFPEKKGDLRDKFARERGASASSSKNQYTHPSVHYSR